MADEITLWRGRPLAECTREELTACLQSLGRLVKSMQHTNALESHVRLQKSRTDASLFTVKRS